MLHVSPENLRSSEKSAIVNKNNRNFGRKSCQAADRIGGTWTASIVAARLAAAFSPRHRALDNKCQKLKPVWGLVTSHEDYVPDLEQFKVGLGSSVDKPLRMTDGNFKSARWLPFETPAHSDYEQFCCKGSTFDAGDPDAPGARGFVHDLPRYRERFRAADKLLKENGCRQEDGALNSELEGPERAREHEREDARQYAGARKVIRANPESFQERAAADMWDRAPYIVNDEILAIEAQDWIIRPMTGKLEADRLLTLAWLKSGLSVPKFFQRLKHKPVEGVRSVADVLVLLDRIRVYVAALTARLNKERVKVKPIVWRLDYGKGILQGIEEIAGYLNLSIGNVQEKIDAGLIPVAAFGGTIIASEKMIIHLRNYHKSASKAKSQVAST